MWSDSAGGNTHRRTGASLERRRQKDARPNRSPKGERNFCFSLFLFPEGIAARTALELLCTLSASAPSYQTVREAVALWERDGSPLNVAVDRGYQPWRLHGRGPRGIAISTDTRGVDIKQSVHAAALMPRLLVQQWVDRQQIVAMSGYGTLLQKFYNKKYFNILIIINVD